MNSLIEQRAIQVRNFLIFSRLAPLVTSFICSIVINKVFLGSPDIFSFESIIIFIGMYLILYTFINHTKNLCEKLAILNQRISSSENSDNNPQ
jgi:hypothetical protein|tara:strand:+ start:1278 stop:1556 length:279 start_codon:yes stop_codon:yes gene_type:complete